MRRKRKVATLTYSTTFRNKILVILFPFFFVLEPEATVDEKLAALLRQLDLEKYIDVFQQQEIDFDSFLTFNDEDLKRIGIK